MLTSESQSAPPHSNTAHNPPYRQFGQLTPGAMLGTVPAINQWAEVARCGCAWGLSATPISRATPYPIGETPFKTR